MTDMRRMIAALFFVVLLPVHAQPILLSGGGRSPSVQGGGEEASVTTACDAVAGSGSAKYVRAGAYGSNNGSSWANAWTEMSSVSLSGMNVGDTLFIAAGTYTTDLPGMTKGIIVRRATVARHGSDTGWSAAFDGQVSVTPSYGNAFVDVDPTSDGFVLDGVDSEPWDNSYFAVRGTRGFSGMFSNNEANNTKVCGIDFNGLSEDNPPGGAEDAIRWDGGANGIIERNYIHHYEQIGGAEQPHSDGIQGPACTNITIRYNKFRNNGIQIFLGDWEWDGRLCNGITIAHNIIYNAPGDSGGYQSITFKGISSGDVIIEHNTIDVSASSQNAGIVSYSTGASNNTPDNQYFRNNIIYVGDIANADADVHTNNLYYNSTGVPAVETGKVTSDPLFVNRATGDYHLQSGSPARNAGANLGYSTDFDGVAIDSSPDMGALQHVP